MQRFLRRHIVSCLAFVCAGVLAVSLVRPSQDATQVRNEVHAVQLAAAIQIPPPNTKVVAQQRNIAQSTPTASALPAGVGVVAFFLVAFSPLIVGLVVCALCVAALYTINFTGVILEELVYRLRQVPPIAAARKAPAATTKKATSSAPRSAAHSKRPNHTPGHAKPAAPTQRPTDKRTHSTKPSAARSGR